VVQLQAQRRNRDRGWATQRGRYLTIRVTGVMLAVLALGHYGLTHIVNDVAETDSSFVARRWASVLWVTWDGLLLGTALLHAAAGLMAVLRDYRTERSSRRSWTTAMLGLTLVLLIIGSATITYGVLG
jgi:succinate dehydrogenase hydrophobic anchor subunit